MNGIQWLLISGDRNYLYSTKMFIIKYDYYSKTMLIQACNYKKYQNSSRLNSVSKCTTQCIYTDVRSFCLLFSTPPPRIL